MRDATLKRRLSTVEGCGAVILRRRTAEAAVPTRGLLEAGKVVASLKSGSRAPMILRSGQERPLAPMVIHLPASTRKAAA